MKRYLLVLMLLAALVSGCSNGTAPFTPASSGSPSEDVGATERTPYGQPESPEGTYDDPEFQEDPGWLAGEPTMTAEVLLKRAKEIPHHPLNPATQLPDEGDAQLAEVLWAKHADGVIGAQEVLYTAIKEFGGLKQSISCQDLPEWSSLSPRQKTVKWHQAVIQWLRQEHESGKLTDKEFEFYEGRMVELRMYPPGKPDARTESPPKVY